MAVGPRSDFASFFPRPSRPHSPAFDLGREREVDYRLRTQRLILPSRAFCSRRLISVPRVQTKTSLPLWRRRPMANILQTAMAHHPARQMSQVGLRPPSIIRASHVNRRGPKGSGPQRTDLCRMARNLGIVMAVRPIFHICRRASASIAADTSLRRGPACPVDLRAHILFNSRDFRRSLRAPNPSATSKKGRAWRAGPIPGAGRRIPQFLLGPVCRPGNSRSVSGQPLQERSPCARDI